MGRKKLNRTEEELREQKRVRDRRYYQKHRKCICKKRMERYLEKKLPKMSERNNTQTQTIL